MEKVFILIEGGAVQSIMATGDTRVYICDRDNGDILPALYAADARVGSGRFNEEAAEICAPPAWWKMPLGVYKHEQDETDVYTIFQEGDQAEGTQIVYGIQGAQEPTRPKFDAASLRAFVDTNIEISYFDLPDDVRQMYEQTIRPAEE